jgi:anti-sigma regulatory factor (Ser/Thr protein kinase)
MLAIHYSKPEETVVLDRQITLVNDLNEVPRLNSFVKEIGAELQLDGKLTRKLMLAIEEAVVNVISYGYTTGTTGKVNVRTAAGKDKLKIVITDNGTPFDPTTTENADTTLSVKDRPIGGLGILLVRQHMDSINYERTDGQNVLTLIKKL